MERTSPSESDRALAKLALTLSDLVPPDTTEDDVAQLLGTFGVNNFGVTNEMHSLVAAG